MAEEYKKKKNSYWNMDLDEPEQVKNKHPVKSAGHNDYQDRKPKNTYPKNNGYWHDGAKGSGNNGGDKNEQSGKRPDWQANKTYSQPRNMSPSYKNNQAQQNQEKKLQTAAYEDIKQTQALQPANPMSEEPIRPQEESPVKNPMLGQPVSNNTLSPLERLMQNDGTANKEESIASITGKTFSGPENGIKSGPAPGAKQPYKKKTQSGKPAPTVLEVNLPPAQQKIKSSDESEKTMSSIGSITAEQSKSLENRSRTIRSEAYPDTASRVNIPRTALERLFPIEKENTMHGTKTGKTGNQTGPKNGSAAKQNTVSPGSQKNQKDDPLAIVKETVLNQLSVMELDGKPVRPGAGFTIDINGLKYTASIETGACAGERKKLIPIETLFPVLKTEGISETTYICRVDFKDMVCHVFLNPLPDKYQQVVFCASDLTIIKIAGKLAALHKLSGERIERLKPFMTWNDERSGFIKGYKEIYLGMLKDLMSNLSYVFRTFSFPENSEKIYDLTSKLSDTRPCLCHGSLDKRCVIISKDNKEVAFTNWEYAIFAPPAYDAAIAIDSLSLDEQQEKVFMDTYIKFSGLPAERFKKDVRIFRALEEVRDGIACLAGAYDGIMSGVFTRKQGPVVANRLCPVLAKAYERLNVPVERRLKEYRVTTAIETWLMERGPAPSEWIPPDATLDEYFERLKKTQYYGI